MGSIRENWEALEEKILSPLAFRSSQSRGRLIPEEQCSIRTDFQRDRDRIIHSKSFRRLKHKTQVFIAPEGDHFRTRLTHTLDVAQISRTIARALGLNEDLTEAIALGHDLGHTPFGHAGEIALNAVLTGGFKHNIQSLRVVEELEGEKGLNLTWEVRDGILNHTGSNFPQTLEGQVVKISDRIAYINHDLDDALRAGIISEEDLPREFQVLGNYHGARIDTMVRDLIFHSTGESLIKMSEAIKLATENLRDFLFQKVYIGSLAKVEEEKAKSLLQALFYYYCEHSDEMPQEYLKRSNQNNLERCVGDYIAGMTDRYATAKYLKIFVPKGFRISY